MTAYAPLEPGTCYPWQVMPKWFVNGCYGLTFLYVAVAVGHHTQVSPILP